MSDTGSEAYPTPVPGSGVNKPADPNYRDDKGTDAGTGNDGQGGSDSNGGSEAPE